MSVGELELLRADPAGNVTLLVLTPVEPELRTSVARALLARCGGEQAGFVTAPRLGGACRLEMMGGEFCGNALRCLGRWWADAHPEASVPVYAEISGCDHPLALWPEGDGVRAELPLPDYLSEWEGMPTAVFPGIVHALRAGPVPSEAEAARLTAELCRRYAAPAAGVMTLSRDLRSMVPAVYVRDTDTLYFESSCASGSAAAAAILSRETPEGESVFALRQPGGTILASARRENGALAALHIAGPVSLGAAFRVRPEGG